MPRLATCVRYLTRYNNYMNNQQRGTPPTQQSRLLPTAQKQNPPLLGGQTRRWYYVAAFVGGVLLGGAALLAWGDREAAPDSNSTSGTISQEETSTSGLSTGGTRSPGNGTATVSDGSDSLRVPDQQPGLSVAVSGTLAAASWVVVHEDRDGVLGNALGAAWFPAGEVNGYVPLLRSTEGERLYHAVIYRDNGDKIFDLHGDSPLRRATGEYVETQFRTLSGAAAR